MNIYEVEFKGVWLGGTATVIAEDKWHVKRLLKKKFEEHEYFIGGNLRINKVGAVEPGVYGFSDGDY